MKNSYEIAVLPGDGIGPEVVDAGLAVLEAAARAYNFAYTTTNYEAGAGYYRETGESMAAADVERVGQADAILLGAMGISDVRHPDGTEINPQIELREHYGLYASLRPCKLFPGVPTNVRSTDVDMLVIRETTEGLFAGRNDPIEPSDEAVSDRLTITRPTSEKLFRLAFEQARLRRDTHGTPGKVTLLDKANVLRSNAFLRKIFDEVAATYPDIASERRYIDSGSMMLVTNPELFDVVVTENVFGDITSEIAAGVVGGLGVAPSGDISDDHGIFQPCHGTAPDIVGQERANPVATVLSVAMLLEWLGAREDDERLIAASAGVREATFQALAAGETTPDLGGKLTTGGVVDAIIRAIPAHELV